MEILTTIVSTLAQLVTIAGGLIAVWGAVILGSNIKDHNGPGINNGIFTIVGGAIIAIAAGLFSSVL